MKDTRRNQKGSSLPEYEEPMEGQMDIFDFLQPASKLNSCKCGNKKLKLRLTGRGNALAFSPTVYEKYLYTVYCPECWRIAADSLGWISHRITKEDAYKDWNSREPIDGNIKRLDVEMWKKYSVEVEE